MKTVKAIRIAWMAVAACLATGAFADDMAVSNVVARQRWPWSRLVDIDYDLYGAPTQRMDIAVSAYNDQLPLPLSAYSLSGDISGLAPGHHRLVWNPVKSPYTTNVLTRFRVALDAFPSPLYVIVDLTKTNQPAQMIEYVYEEDLFTNKWGAVTSAWETRAVTNGESIAESVIWTGLTNDIAFMTEKIVLRRVPAGSFMMGDSSNIPASLTQDFYIGVFEVTQDQWKRIYGGEPSGKFAFPSPDGTLPAENISYDHIRGSPANGGAGWPTNDNVYAQSLVGKLRGMTGMLGFNLPTDVQWEYACRAGTTSYYSDGVSTGIDTNILNTLAWWKENSATPAYTNGQTHTVGQKLPNAWGLYDMHGNVREWCLDFYDPLPNPVPADYPGPWKPALNPVSGTQYTRVCRSGAWSESGANFRSSYRMSATPEWDYTGVKIYGLRLVLNRP